MPFSSHHCLGGWDAVPPTRSADLGSVDVPTSRLTRNQHERGCAFYNCCFSGAGELLYFARPGEFESASRSFPSGIDVYSRGGFGRAVPARDRLLAIRRSAVPAEAGWLTAETVVSLTLFAPSNFGHFLGNGLFPAFHAAWRFGGAALATRRDSLQLLLGGRAFGNASQLRAGRCAGSQGERGCHGAGGSGADPALVAKFVRGLAPGLTSRRVLWEEELPWLARAERGGLLCVRRLLVGGGGLSFSTALGTPPRRPPLPLWGDFIEHLSRGVLGGEQAEPPAAVLLLKRGRRAPTARAAAELDAALRSALPPAARVRRLDPAAMSVRDQLRAVAASPIGLTPDGGISLLCAFMPAGAALLVLGSLERWLWSNDRRVRAFYCSPEEGAPRVPCEGGSRAGSVTADCYEAAAVRQCVRGVMLPRAIAHAAATWPLEREEFWKRVGT